MSIETRHISVSGIAVMVVRKPIKNLHLGVYPPNGRVRVAAPLRVSDNAVRLAVVSRLGWIRRQQRKFATQIRQSRRQMVSGEAHYVFGRRLRLRIVRDGQPGMVRQRSKGILEISAGPKMSRERRQEFLVRWYRQELKRRIPVLLEKWQGRVGVSVAAWGVRRMKTKWGSCNPDSARIWLNLELAKKPEPCLEYLVVHELVHLRERRHNDRFLALMKEYLPRWRQRRDELNEAPLAHEDWSY